MKKAITIILAILILVSCQNDSFEDYVEWCDEKVEYKVARYYVEGYDIYSTSHGNHKTLWICDDYINQTMLDVLIERQQRHMFEFKHINSAFEVKTKNRETPTIKGYQKWKGKQK